MHDRAFENHEPGTPISLSIPFGALLSAIILWLLFLFALPAWAGRVEGPSAELPDAPTPQNASASPLDPAPQNMVEAQHLQHKPVIDYTSNGTPCEELHGETPGTATTNPYGVSLAPCPHHKIPQTSERFVSGTQAQHHTVKDKARMAERDLIDPYDAATIAADSGITVGSDPHSRYGPGLRGFGEDVGVGLAQDSSAEVTNTFLIPTLTHEDPQYHREPDASKKHRVEHAVVQTVWTESDKGKGMPNYSNLVGDAADDELGDFYVPGTRRSVMATAERYGTSLGMTPVDNLVTEFTPDLASHVHLKSAFWQSIVDQVAGVSRGGAAVAAARRHSGTPQSAHSSHRH